MSLVGNSNKQYKIVVVFSENQNWFSENQNWRPSKGTLGSPTTTVVQQTPRCEITNCCGTATILLRYCRDTAAILLRYWWLWRWWRSCCCRSRFRVCFYVVWWLPWRTMCVAPCGVYGVPCTVWDRGNINRPTVVWYTIKREGLGLRRI